MGITPQTVFLSLDEPQRRALLERHGLSPTSEQLEGEFSSLVRKAFRDINHDLACVAMLGSDHAAPMVHDYLTANGWTPDAFAASRSARDRACVLLCQFTDAFQEALAIWNGNRLRGGIERERGFRLPDVGDFDFEPLDESDAAQLKDLVQAALADTHPNKRVTCVNLFERDSRGLPTSSEMVLQCDVSFGDDPETIEVVEGGVETTITLERLSRISIIIDVNGRSLFVGTTIKKKALHQALARCIAGFLFDKADPLKPLSALRVYPEKCRSPITFRFDSKDGIERIRISELRYRLFGASNLLVYRVRDHDPSSDIHSHEDVTRHAWRMRVWGAVIEFDFWPVGDGPPISRPITLIEPSTIGFGRAFPEERLTIEKVLVESGLIDPNFSWDTRARFTQIARLITPQHLAELRRSWLPLTVSKLQDAGILKQGRPSSRAWCETCGQTHGIVRRAVDGEDKYYVECAFDSCELTDDHVDTRVLSVDGLLNWLSANAVAASQPPRAIGGAGRAWFLGAAERPKSTRAFELILAIDVDQPETTRDLNEYLFHRHTGGRGLVLTLTEDPKQQVFPQGWRVASLHAVCEVKHAGLKFKSNWAAKLLGGKREPKAQKTDEEWDEIFALFEAMYPGDTPLQHYPVANEMIAESDLCDMTVRRLAEKLLDRFPDRFEAGCV